MDAVTDTTMIVAAGIISLRSTLVTSSSFCNSYEDESRQSVIQHEHTGLEVVHLFTRKSVLIVWSFTWSLVKMTRLSILDYKSRVLACATCAMELVTTGVTASHFIWDVRRLMPKISEAIGRMVNIPVSCFLSAWNYCLGWPIRTAFGNIVC